jgi:hypothetical protein
MHDAWMSKIIKFRLQILRVEKTSILDTKAKDFMLLVSKHVPKEALNFMIFSF